jgi:BASS family bile acid:Na+ symporter
MNPGIFAFLRRHGTKFMAGGLLLGIAVPALAALLRPTLPALVFLLTVATFLSVEWSALMAHARRPSLLLLIPLSLLVGSPVVALGLARLVDLPTPLAQGFVLWAASPALAAVSAIAMLLGLDEALALLVMIVSTFLMPLVLPPLALGLLGLQLGIGIGTLMIRLALFVGAAALTSVVLRRLIGPERLRRNVVRIGGFNVLLMFLFAMAVMDGVQGLILAEPWTVLLYAATSMIGALVMQAASTLVFWRLGRVPALTVGLIGGNRNMAVVWANLGSAATPELLLFFAAMQLPIYILPGALRPIYRRLGAKPIDR